MDMSRKQAEFFAAIILLCTVTAALILVIDYQIKGAILEESNRMRKAIEGWNNGQGPATANGNRRIGDPGYDTPYPSDMVDRGTTGMETRGTNTEPRTADKAAKPGRAKSARQDGPGSIPDTD